MIEPRDERAVAVAKDLRDRAAAPAEPQVGVETAGDVRWLACAALHAKELLELQPAQVERRLPARRVDAAVEHERAAQVTLRRPQVEVLQAQHAVDEREVRARGLQPREQRRPEIELGEVD